jgi:hypothetical protein
VNGRAHLGGRPPRCNSTGTPIRTRRRRASRRDEPAWPAQPRRSCRAIATHRGRTSHRRPRAERNGSEATRPDRHAVGGSRAGRDRPCKGTMRLIIDGSGGGCGPAHPGGTFRRCIRPGRPCIAGSAAGSATASGPRYWPRCRPGRTQKEPPGGVQAEPADHGLGRSRGGWTTETPLACEQSRKVMAMVVTAGQRGDSPRVTRAGGGRPHMVLAFQGQPGPPAIARHPGMHVSPARPDQDAHRKAKGSTGGRRPPSILGHTACGTPWNAATNQLKQHRAIAAVNRNMA